MRKSVLLTFFALFVNTAFSMVVRPDSIQAAPGVAVAIAENGEISVSSPHATVDEIRLVWKRQHDKATPICRNDWERAYGEAGWTALAKNPGSAWYFLVREGQRVDGWGVAVQPSALCWWTVSESEIVLTLDVR